ncbi:cytochrome P450 [Actinomadura sp. 9N407]|uniref:cytochrome P450 n=1 Tax=Actinomadura sp. 9N407 TaxID=3375154 RepID=UPI0037AC6B20
MPRRRGTHPVSDADALACPDTYARGVPYDRLERLRARTPVVWLDERIAGGPGSWAVLRYADVRHALAHPELFAAESGTAPHGTPGPTAGPPAGPATGPATGMIDMEPPAGALLARITADPADFAAEVAAELPGTLRNTLAGGLYALLRDPEQYARLRASRADDDLVDSAVEEMLRWWTPVMCVRRTVLRPTIMGGVPLLAGERVSLWLTAADHDDTVFPEPERFVPDRFRVGAGARPQLALGYGTHACLGAMLARLHLRALVTAVLERPGRLASAGDPVRLRSTVRQGFERLPVRWIA